MGKIPFRIALYLLASMMVLIGLSLMVFEIRNSIPISPQVAPAASTFMMVSAMYLIGRAHRD